MLTDLFNKDYKKTPIGMIGSIKRTNKNQTLIVQANEINQLLQHNECYQNFNDNKKYKVLRFLLRTNGELVFAHEGGPQGIVPAHWQMAGTVNVASAKCITAGNAYFNIEDNTLELINHKSGDFRPPFDSLQFVFPKLIKDNILISNTLQIVQLNSSGASLKKYQTNQEDIVKYSKSQMADDNEESIIKIESPDFELDLYRKKLNDLKLLKQFHDEKLALNSDNQFGAGYSQSIKQFYNKAIEIRKSNKSHKQISEDLKQLAHDQFYHRHSTRRLIADVLIIISTMFFGLGLFVGLGRVALGYTFFFSNEKTSREREFSQNWINRLAI